MAGEKEEQQPYSFRKGAIATTEVEAFSNLAEQMIKNAKPNPPVDVPAPPNKTEPTNIATPEKKDGEGDAEKEKVQDKSEMEIPAEQPKVEDKKAKKGGKKGKEEPKAELPEIVDGEGNKVDMQSFSEEDNDNFLELIGEKKEVKDAVDVQKDTKNKETKVALSKEAKERIDFLEAENKTLKSDPAYAIAKELIGKGKDGVKELMNKFDLTDYDKLSNKDIYEIDLKGQGLEGEELKEALEEFESLPTYKQKTTTNPLRSKLKEGADEKLKSISNVPSEKTIREQVKYQQEAADNALAALDERFEKIATKGYNGWKPKEEDLAIIRDGVMNNTVVAQKDGKPYYDVDASIEQSIWMNPQIRNKILKYANELGRFKGYDDFISERIRVNPKEHIAGSQGGKPTYSFNNTVKPAQNGSN